MGFEEILILFTNSEYSIKILCDSLKIYVEPKIIPKIHKATHGPFTLKRQDCPH